MLRPSVLQAGPDRGHSVHIRIAAPVRGGSIRDIEPRLRPVTFPLRVPRPVAVGHCGAVVLSASQERHYVSLLGVDTPELGGRDAPGARLPVVEIALIVLHRAEMDATVVTHPQGRRV